MKRVVGLAVFLVALHGTAHAGGPQVRACKFEVKARCASGDVSVTLKDGAVQKLDILIFWCGLPGRPGYTCTVDSTRGEDDTWSEDGGATVIDNATAFNDTRPDRVKVTVGKYVSIDFAEAQSAGRCGAGAELPRAIVIPAQGGACRVWLDKR